MAQKTLPIWHCTLAAVAMPWHTYHSHYATADTKAAMPRHRNHSRCAMVQKPLPVCHGSETTTDMPLHRNHRRYDMGQKPLSLCHCTVTTANMPWHRNHCQYAMEQKPPSLCHGPVTTAAIATAQKSTPICHPMESTDNNYYTGPWSQFPPISQL
jgi:hypothetical protein